MMSRERELLLALFDFTRKAGHAARCDTSVYEGPEVSCTCGYNDLMEAGDWFTRNAPR